MTQHEWQYLESVIGAMTPEDKQRLVLMLSEPTSMEPDEHFHKWRQRNLELQRKIATEEQRIAELRKDSAATDHSPPFEADDPIIGCMADESDLLDEIMEGIYRDRENLPFRAVE
jgi:hypothetical protein